MYNETNDTVEWIQEELEDIEVLTEITEADIAKLTIEDVDAIMLDKDYAKA
tara:strand:- start:238 stop:390 length:153 start_codon:yes stop_codon:yes gene_type:complete